MEKRNFDNTFSDYTEKNAENIIENDKPKYNEKLIQYLEQEWKSHFKNYIQNEDYSIYTGSSGIAFLKFLKSMKTQKSELLKEAKELLPIHLLKNRRVSFLCGDAGPLALAAVIEHQLGNQKESKILIERLVNMSTDVLNKESSLPNELLYGRSGYLYALLFINKNIGNETIKSTLITQVIKTILVLGQKESKAMKLKCPLMYSWHDKCYLGAAHGLSGILFMILQAQEYTDKADIKNLVKPSIDFLVSLQFPLGNFPSSLGNKKDSLVQWCHGAPGFVNLLCLAYKTFEEENYLQFALQCGEIVWKRGLLTKGYSICHGVAGNAYTFLTLFKYTQEKKHLYRACKFAEWCIDYTTNHEYHYPDRPYSLYEGLAGRLYLLIDIQDPLNAKFPGYEI